MHSVFPSRWRSVKLNQRTSCLWMLFKGNPLNAFFYFYFFTFAVRLASLKQALFSEITAKYLKYFANPFFHNVFLACFLSDMEQRGSLCFPAREFFFFFFLLNGGAETLGTGPRGRGLVRSATSLPSARREAAGSPCRRSQLLTPNGGSSRSSRSMLMSAASTVIYSIFNPRLPLAGQPWRGGQSQLGRGRDFCSFSIQPSPGRHRSKM